MMLVWLDSLSIVYVMRVGIQSINFWDGRLHREISLHSMFCTAVFLQCGRHVFFAWMLCRQKVSLIFKSELFRLSPNELFGKTAIENVSTWKSQTRVDEKRKALNIPTCLSELKCPSIHMRRETKPKKPNLKVRQRWRRGLLRVAYLPQPPIRHQSQRQQAVTPPMEWKARSILESLCQMHGKGFNSPIYLQFVSEESLK